MSRESGAAGRSPGEPLLALAVVLGGWIILRVLLWQSPFDARAVAAEAGHHRSAPASVLGSGPAAATLATPLVDGGNWFLASDVGAVALRLVPRSATDSRPQLDHAPSAPGGLPLLPESGPIPLRERAATLLAPSPEAFRANPAPPSARLSPWSADAWVMWRQGSSAPLAAVGPSYGRSQAGAVLRYRLAGTSGHRPVAYARMSRALSDPTETEFAAGVSVRPLARIPVSFAAEMRVTDRALGREVRPAAFAVTELPALSLPHGLRAEAYAQAGHVGGRFATAFVDGQGRLDAPVATIGKDARARLGAGVWGGAQKGAARLDVGPSAALGFPLGRAWSRVALDYRFRVAGDASPKSGPALTISAGF